MTEVEMMRDAIVWANHIRNTRLYPLRRLACRIAGHRWEPQGFWRMCTRCAESEWIPEEVAKRCPWPEQDVEEALRICYEATQPKPLIFPSDV